jgi:NADH-quinone oxidoreductase subunit N
MWYTYWNPIQDCPDLANSFLDLGIALIIFSLFIKLGLAPFHLWSLDVYEGSPTPTTFFFAVISKLSVFVILLRFSCQLFGSFPNKDVWSNYGLIIAVLSVFVGSFGGLQTRKLKTLLAYSSTSHMGYILLAYSTARPFFIIQSTLFYFVIYIIAGLATWFIVMSLTLKTKTSQKKYNKELGDFVLLHKSNPALALAFALTMFSTAGIPPMIGFLAKMLVFFNVILGGIYEKYVDHWDNEPPYDDDFKAVDIYYTEFYLAAVLAILCSVISTFYYIRIIKILYFENLLIGKLYHPINNQKILLLSILIFLMLFLLVYPTPIHLSVIFASLGYIEYQKGFPIYFL